jgi:hypothetical protein
MVVPASGQFQWHVNPSTQPRGDEAAWHLSVVQGGTDTPCKDVFVARAQSVNVNCAGAAAAAGSTTTTTPAKCTLPNGFRSVSVRILKGRKAIRFSFRRRTGNKVTIGVFQNSKGRKILTPIKRVARFRNRTKAVTWHGRKTAGSKGGVTRGVFYVRFRVLDANKRIDSRRIVIEKRGNGRWYKQGKFVLENHC